MLDQIDGLPGAEEGDAVFHGYRQIDLGKGGSNMGRHVVRALRRVAVSRIFRGHTAKGCQEIGLDVGIGVFLDKQGGRCVLAPERQQGGGHMLGTDPFAGRTGIL